MEPIVLSQFLRQAELQCRYAFASYEMVQRAEAVQDITTVFYGAQNLVTALGNAAKVFWGLKAEKTAARRLVRERAGVAEDSPLKDVSMRNHYEHMDERIERWGKDSRRRNLVDLVCGPKGIIVGLEDIDMFRQFDPSSGVLYFWGAEFHVGAIMQDVAAFYPQLQREAGRPHWEHMTPESPSA